MPDLSNGAPWPNGAVVVMLGQWTHKASNYLFTLVACDATLNRVRLYNNAYSQIIWEGTYQQLVDEFYLS